MGRRFGFFGMMGGMACGSKMIIHDVVQIGSNKQQSSSCSDTVV